MMAKFEVTTLLVGPGTLINPGAELEEGGVYLPKPGEKPVGLQEVGWQALQAGKLRKIAEPKKKAPPKVEK